MAGEIHEILDRAGLRAPRLQHGDGALTWILIEDAARRGWIPGSDWKTPCTFPTAAARRETLLWSGRRATSGPAQPD